MSIECALRNELVERLAGLFFTVKGEKSANILVGANMRPDWDVVSGDSHGHSDL